MVKKGSRQANLKKKKAVDDAAKTGRTVRTGDKTITRRKRTSVLFRRPTTQTQKRDPKYPRKSLPSQKKFDKYQIIKHPLTTESAMKKIEDHNTLLFICDIKANKAQIKAAVKEMYDVTVKSINTLIRPDGKKKAFVKLDASNDALDIANRIGII